MKNYGFACLLRLCLAVLAVAVCIQAVPAQKFDRIERERLAGYLKQTRKLISEHYYDPQFGGMDLEARFKQAEEKLKGATSVGQGFSIIAQAVVDMNDSHTTFYPPATNLMVSYGWRVRMFGDKPLITFVKEKSDAQNKGLKVGDEVLAINGFRPNRKELRKMLYYYLTLNPQKRMVLDVKSPNGEVRKLEIDSDVKQLKRVMNLTNTVEFNEAVRDGDKVDQLSRHYFKDINGVLIWKMPSFSFDPSQVERFMAEPKGKRAMILDLRNNGGGYVVTLEKIAGYFFENDVKIAELKGRKKMDPQIARSRGQDGFKGNVIVLVDANSGSASEIFARLMQLENRGKVIGDVSAGAVMQSRFRTVDAGVDTLIQYGVSVTEADVIMSDGKSLEHVGVIPDISVIPTGEDLALRRDPALAKALEELGIKITSDDAGKIFPDEIEVEFSTNFPISLRW